MARLTAHREGEQPPVEAALRKLVRDRELPPGARLEGGDVLHVDETTYVGLSMRTNEQAPKRCGTF